MAEYKIEELIIESLMETAKLITDGKCSSRIIIPDYRTRKDIKEEKRYSEQELKQIFLNRIENNSSFLYSVETPSKWLYSFKDEPEVSIKKEEHFLSSRIDVSLYDNCNGTERQLVSHIEFKYGQCDKDAVQKDFLKLICESEKTCKSYFVHYVSSNTPRAKKALFEDKFKKALDNIKNHNDNISGFMKERLEKIVVFVMFIDLSHKTSSEIFKIPLNRMEGFSPENKEGKELEENICLYEVK